MPSSCNDFQRSQGVKDVRSVEAAALSPSCRHRSTCSASAAGSTCNRLAWPGSTSSSSWTACHHQLWNAMNKTSDEERKWGKWSRKNLLSLLAENFNLKAVTKSHKHRHSRGPIGIIIICIPPPAPPAPPPPGFSLLSTPPLAWQITIQKDKVHK